MEMEEVESCSFLLVSVTLQPSPERKPSPNAKIVGTGNGGQNICLHSNAGVLRVREASPAKGQSRSENDTSEHGHMQKCTATIKPLQAH
ncbi:hypothetical protein CRENBAI_009527 [Crenichthys baileyi]|uniref:Uncharacterized protein n=1 Tax=Crenichthys baileyi TaxID=28760 RepID=A0AAV9RS74_9TELE